MLLTVYQVAAQFGVNHRTVRRWIKGGRLTAHKLSHRCLRVDEKDLAAFQAKAKKDAES